MGPKKEAPKKENAVKIPAIEDPLNSDTWRCVVVMGVERTYSDNFVLKQFMEEASRGRRQEVKLINFDGFLLKILNDFANGELAFKYAYLLNFSSVFQEAAEFVKKKLDISIPVLAKVIKAVLFFFREESLIKIEKKAAGPPDPVKAMAERPANLGGPESKGKSNKKESVPAKGKKTEGETKLKPASASKHDTKLLKRGEGVREDECIDDAPADGYFNLYVLLTGFYFPDLPLELISAGIPFHGLLCVDTSLAGMKRVSSAYSKLQKQISKTRSDEIKNFWDVFLQILWDPKVTSKFKDVIFRVYVPKKLSCDEKKLREFIYQEISYLLYDMSDYKKQLLNYLEHLNLRSVEDERRFGRTKQVLGIVGLPDECVTPPVVLQYLLDAICTEESTCFPEPSSSDSIDFQDEPSLMEKYIPQSLLLNYDSATVEPAWSQLVADAGHSNLPNVYSKTTELDEKYNLDEREYWCDDSKEASSENGIDEGTCPFDKFTCGENMEDALNSEGSALKSIWRKFKTDRETASPFVAVDHCLYSLLMTRVVCPYQDTPPSPKSFANFQKNSIFELIENSNEEIRKPHFTVTEGSRSVLRSIPYNVKDVARDFFSPPEFKVVSPEKLKACSAPEFFMAPRPNVRTSFASDFLPGEAPRNTNLNLFEDLREFLGEEFFADANGFDFVEELSKGKLLQKEYEHWDRYNCIDHCYSVLNDSIFVVLHNRTDGDDCHHETFNEALRTGVGLRDFFEYVLDDESEWFGKQHELRRTQASLLERDSCRAGDRVVFSERDFWSTDSIKYEEYLKIDRRSKSEDKAGDFKRTAGADEGQKRNPSRSQESVAGVDPEESYRFEGYEVGEAAVQYSGLKTAYYEDDCSATVELVERLYGDQDLRLHLAQGSHVLHLYSYVCPRPHVLDPYAFHLSYKNGMIVAFCRRFVESFRELEEIAESKTTPKNKKSSSELSTGVVKRETSRLLRDEEFSYDMKLSYPNGLTVEVVRRAADPCYIRQEYLVEAEAGSECRRLFLPNGDLVLMMADDAVRVLRANASVVNASVGDLVEDSDALAFKNYEVVTAEGLACVFVQNALVSSARLHTFQNTDVETNRTFFRRADDTNYMLEGDGSMCVLFEDGTKMRCSPFVVEDASPAGETREEEAVFGGEEEGEEESLGGSDFSEFVFVHKEVVFEHPAYATVAFATDTRRWKILLPFDSTVTVEPEGNYSVDVDKRTELKVENDLLQMKRFSPSGELTCSATADLTVFDNEESGVYCRMENSSGKTFVVEANACCYVLNDDCASEGSMRRSDDSTSVRSAERNRLSRKNKYLVTRRDVTGLEVLHKSDVEKTLTEVPGGHVVFTQRVPGTEKRCFVLVSPAAKKKTRKWEVDTILPDPKFVAGSVKKTSSTYGHPPSWMHPFPRRKAKFDAPEELTCRVFIETKKTDLSPPGGTVDCFYCEAEAPPVKHTQILDFRDYVKRLSHDDQDILKEMYAISVAKLVNDRKPKAGDSRKLRHYLELSRYYVEMQEYHKHSIRHRLVPNYFRHPAGMSWLILDDLLTRSKLSRPASPARVPTPPTRGSVSTFSNEELEYNLSPSSDRSFSDVSHRTGLSAETAPAFLETGGLCRSKVTAARESASAPFQQLRDREGTSSEEASRSSRDRACTFRDGDVDLLEKREGQSETFSSLTLEDLMCLGLV